VTRKEVDEIKGHFDQAMGTLRRELTTEIGRVREELGVEIAGIRAEIAEIREHLGGMAEGFRSQIRVVADGTAGVTKHIHDLDLRVDGLAGEMRRGFAGVRAEMHSLHETDDELGQRIGAQEQRGA